MEVGMSVDLTIVGVDGAVEFVPLCGQGTWTHWVAEVGRRRGFRILTGVDPSYVVGREDVERAIWEVGVVWEEDLRRIEVHAGWDEAERAAARGFAERRWGKVVERLERLRGERWERWERWERVYFG
jgi:hypothetical protein